MRKLPTRKLLGAVVAAALLLPGSGFTLGLGEIEVNSALNQRLNADIELLSATPEDAEDIIIKLASRKEFTRAGLDRPYLLNDLRFKSEEINGVPYIKVSSASPIREPFLNFLVEIDWPNGHLLREYTVLLDPPVFMTQAASVASSTANQGSDNASSRPTPGSSNNVAAVLAPAVMPGVSLSSRPESSEQAADSPASAASQSIWAPAPVKQQQASINQPAGSYKINSGDTAWKLAHAMRPDQSITVPQMMIAMLRTNPESFINGNINGLKRGYILRVPDYDEIVSIDTAEASEAVRQQAALWRQYQQSQAGGDPTSAMPQDEKPASADFGSSDAAVEENDAYLEIVSAGTGSSTVGGKDPTEMTVQELRSELALARERVETGLVEKEALQQRVEVLESNVNKMKGMLTIEDTELATVESLGSEIEPMPAEGVLPDSEAVADVPVEDVVAVDAEAADETAAVESTDPEYLEIMADEALLAEDAELVEGATAESTDEALFTDEMTGESDVTPAEMPEQLTPEMAATSDAVIDEPQIADREPADPLSQLLNNPMMLAAAGAGLLFIAILIGLIVKRRKSAAAANAVTSGFDNLDILADEAASMDSAVEDDIPAGDETAAEGDFDSESTMTLDSSEDTINTEADAAADKAEDEPRDDVIAEADVYLAYGIYQQAEELLSQAIADHPERDDYRVKLAETHYASKNAKAFTEVASQLKSRVENDSVMWKKVMPMGQDLCADNPMFQGSMVGGLDIEAISPGSPEMDFDLGINDADGSDTAVDLGLNLDEQPLDLPEMDDMAAVLDEDDENDIVAEPVDELEFDLSDAGASEKTDTEEEFSLDIDASELDIDIDNNSNVITDIDFGLDEVAAVAEDEEEISLDLTDEVAALDMDMDLGEAAEVDADAEAVPSLAALPDDYSDEEDFDLSSLDDVDEISTKLDLARAYLDMGDHEGTKGILEEVIADGDDEQKQEANELMSKLG